MKRTFRRNGWPVLALAGLCAGLLSTGPRASAQQGLRKLTGTVMSAGHKPLQGAVVQLVDEKTNAVESYVTTASGIYTFKRLEAGTDYHFYARYQGRQSKTRRLGMFDSKADETVNLVVHVP